MALSTLILIAVLVPLGYVLCTIWDALTSKPTESAWQPTEPQERGSRARDGEREWRGD